MDLYHVTGIAFRRGSDFVVNPSFEDYTHAKDGNNAVRNVVFRYNKSHSAEIELRCVNTEIVKPVVKAPIVEQLKLF